MSTQAVLNPATIKAMDSIFPIGPSEVLVKKFMEALQREPRFIKLFGAFKGIAEDNQRWADYQRFDWSHRHLPAINIYESETDEKTSDQAWLLGTIKLMVLWPAAMRRSALTRVQKKFQAALLEWLSSDLCYSLLDPMPGFNEATKCPGLNEFGKSTLDTKNVEGIVDSELVPVTMIDIKFRLDFRKWFMWLEQEYRTKELPFDVTLADFVGLRSLPADGPNGIAGVVNANTEDVQILIKSDPDVLP